MPRYQVTIILEIVSDTPDGADEIAVGAIEHLHETFNDDESIGVAFTTTVVKLED